MEADWDEQWHRQPFDVRVVAEEARTPRWRAQERLVTSAFGGFDGMRVIEVGAGRGTNAALYAQRGADVVLLDTSIVALEQAEALFEQLGLRAEYVLGDAFAPDPSLAASFDVAMSFGLCEHFVGDRRREIVRAHLRFLDERGVAFLSVPNRWSPLYRLWMATLKRMGRWELGTEEPFTAGELQRLVREAGGVPLEPCYGSFAASVIGLGLNQGLSKLRLPQVPVPQAALPVIDRFAYELLVPACRDEFDGADISR